MAIEPLPTNRRPVRTVGESLDRVRLALGLARPDSFETIREHWAQLVGSRLARSCSVESLRDGRLVVSTTIPAVGEQLRWQSRDLCAAVGDLCDDPELVRSVDVRVLPPGPAGR
ncbi:MAG: DUF721 domain-containing protein [Microthrixaceae bacterium]